MSHPALLRRLGVSLGVSEERLNADLEQEASRYRGRLLALCGSRSHAEGLGAIGNGNGYLVLFECRSLRTMT